MKNEHHDSWQHEEVERMVRDEFQKEVPEEVTSRMREALKGFRMDLRHHPHVMRLNRRGISPGRTWGFPITPRAGLAALVALLALVWIALLLAASGSPTWAQVEATFESTGSFQATVYFKDDALAQPVQFELWKGDGGRGRMRDGNRVVFAENGAVTDEFDVLTGEKLRVEPAPNRQATAILAAMTSSEEFSLNTIIQWAGGDLAETTPRVNSSAAISEDLAVFDIQSARTPEWLRIWTLRKSGLPIRLRSQDPRDGECLELLFSYSAEQPPEFFDPEAYERFVTEHPRSGRSTSADNGLAYAFLSDPGGKQISMWPRPEANAAELFAFTARTLDGEAWTLGDQRGKTVLLAFWGTNSWERPYEQWLDWLKAAHESYGERADFVMVGVALGDDVNALRAFADESAMDFPNLYVPGRPFDNALVKAMGVRRLPSVWLIRKDGSFEEVWDFSSGQLEGAVQDFCYAAATDLYLLLSKKQREGGLTEEDAREILGEPASTEEGEGGTIYRYRAPNDANTREAWISLTFDAEGTLRGSGQGRSIIDPAIVSVTIGEQFWRERVLAEIGPSLSPDDNGDCILQITARTGNTMMPFYGPQGEQEAVPGIPYTRQLVAGVYRFTAGVYNTREHRLEQEVVLREGIKLEKNQKLDIHVD